MSDAVFLCPEVQSSSPAVAVTPPEFFSNKPGLVRYTVRVLNLSSLQQRPAASITVSCALTGQRAVVTARAVAGECPPGECPQFWTYQSPVPVYSAPIHPDSPSQYSGWCCPEGAALKVLPLAGRWGRLGELQSAWLTPPPPFSFAPQGSAAQWEFTSSLQALTRSSSSLSLLFWDQQLLRTSVSARAPSVTN